MFFATDEQISKANTLLQGKVKLEKSGSHYLAITRGSVSTTLWWVQPVVAHGPSARRPQGTVEHGLDVNLPRRCNEMAKAVPGQEGLADHGTDAYFEALANILAEVKHKKAPRAKDYAKAKKEAGRDPAKIGKYSQVMQQLIEGVLSHQGEEPLEAAIKKYRLNQYTPPRCCRRCADDQDQAPGARGRRLRLPLRVGRRHEWLGLHHHGELHPPRRGEGDERPAVVLRDARHSAESAIVP
ncbi:hypothetical protein ACWGH5_28900 [Streptomyces sp. NPDC054864]